LSRPMSSSIRIELLADFPEHVETLARWCHGQWGFIHPDDTLDARTARLRERLGREGVPSVYVALSGGTLLGSASLVNHDLASRADLSPWLASLYVAPESRRRGVGEMLVGRVVARARELRYASLYLYTFDHESYYARRGWTTIGNAEVAGRAIAIMSIDTRGNV
jgi:N-acetylglutamate synthase-like GNAT family acetyltransferase